MDIKESKRLFFIALLPPLEVQSIANQIKREFAEIYNSRAAQKSPPHITLVPPFEWELQDMTILEQVLREFSASQNTLSIILKGFGAFKPRVIYINVLKTPELLTWQKKLTSYLESSLAIVDERSKNRSFSPHLTVAYKDLTEDNFYMAWPEFEKLELDFEFIVPRLTLLIHNNKRWEIFQEYSFNKSLDA